jgi:MarR-like DNA-binding transcriptional regulator SgrR of sgrS sRNA
MENKTILGGIKQQVEELKNKTTSKPTRIALNKLWDTIMLTEQHLEIKLNQLQEENNRLRRL